MFKLPVGIASGGSAAWFLTCLFVLSLGVGQSSLAEKKADTQKGLKVGDAAPDFALKGTDDKTYKLSDFKGKRAVIVAWYPKALTGG